MQSRFRTVCRCILTILWISDLMEAVCQFIIVEKLTVFRHFLFSSLWTLFFSWLLATFDDKLGAGARLGQTLHTPTQIPPPVLEQICDAGRRKVNTYEDIESVTPWVPLRLHYHQPTYARGGWRDEIRSAVKAYKTAQMAHENARNAFSGLCQGYKNHGRSFFSAHHPLGKSELTDLMELAAPLPGFAQRCASTLFSSTFRVVTLRQNARLICQGLG